MRERYKERHLFIPTQRLMEYSKAAAEWPRVEYKRIHRSPVLPDSFPQPVVSLMC